MGLAWAGSYKYDMSTKSRLSSFPRVAWKRDPTCFFSTACHSGQKDYAKTLRGGENEGESDLLARTFQVLSIMNIYQ